MLAILWHETHLLDRIGVSVLAAVTGGATGGFDPVIGGIVGVVIMTAGTVAVALIGKSGRAAPADDDDGLHVPRDEWEVRVRESERWRAYQEEQAELRELREDR